jgi:hypothetical protein
MLAAVVLALFLFLRTGEDTPVVRQEQRSQPDAANAQPTPEQAPEQAPTPEGSGAQEGQDAPPAKPPVVVAPSQTPAPRPARAPQRTGEQLTVANVRRVYVSMGGGDYDRRLREALIEQLRAGDRFTVVAGAQQADAVLLREQSRGAGVSVQLMSRTGKPLWFTTQPAGDVESVGDLAARIVAALGAAADSPPPPSNAPRR